MKHKVIRAGLHSLAVIIPASFTHALGIKKGDRLAILSENRPEWVVCDLSAASLGAILAPIHTPLTWA